MALERLTQITEVGIQSGITLRNVNVEGAYVSGVVTATSLNVTSAGANFTGVVTATNFDGNVTGNINPTTLNVSGVSTFGASSFWGDGDVAYFGDGQDLLIFHNSTDSIIRDNGTGDLFIEGGNRIRLTNPTGIETYAVFNQDGAVELYHDNVKKLETSGIGVTITSSLTVGTGASISSPETNVLTLGTNNSERVRINSTGHVGILSTLSIGTNTQVTSSTGLNPVITVGSATTSRLVWGTPGSDNYRLNLSGGGALVFGVDGDSENFGIEGHQAGVQHLKYFGIDNYGRVTKPYQLWIAGSPTNTGGSGVFNSFSTSLFASPVGLSFVTDRITVPIAGVYMITFNTICDNTSARKDTLIMVNGSTISSQLSEDSTAGYHYRSASLAVKLSASDYIQFYNEDWYDATTASVSWRTASVYLLG